MRALAQALFNLEAWLETMRGPDGYGGPVVHWWQNCLSYAGAGLDWRYEGIILGYLVLWEKTGETRWLEKACCAGDDLVRGQLPGGNYRHSSFELNPYPGGTPHEAAADLGLLRLALALRGNGDERWRRYAATAERNLLAFYIDRMWDPEALSFRDRPDLPSLVPNKVCTLVEALFAWAELRGDDQPIEAYALPALRAVVALQLSKPDRLAGAIAQNRIGGEIVEAYYPYYIARCVPALLLAHRHTGNQRWLDVAAAAFSFVANHVCEDGLLPQVIYRRGRNRYPQWIAPLGDVLGVARLLEMRGLPFALNATEEAFLAGQLPIGAFATGRGFGAQVSQRPADVETELPDFRDNLSVVGWNDKAFRYLAGRLEAGEPLPLAEVAHTVLDCRVGGRPAIWRETRHDLTMSQGTQSVYAWTKGEPWARKRARQALRQ